MTAHIDSEEQETESCECDPHDNHKLRQKVAELKEKLTEWKFLAFWGWFFTVIAVIERIGD